MPLSAGRSAGAAMARSRLKALLRRQREASDTRAGAALAAVFGMTQGVLLRGS
jgi:hypothetical protein